MPAASVAGFALVAENRPGRGVLAAYLLAVAAGLAHSNGMGGPSTLEATELAVVQRAFGRVIEDYGPSPPP